MCSRNRQKCDLITHHEVSASLISTNEEIRLLAAKSVKVIAIKVDKPDTLAQFLDSLYNTYSGSPASSNSVLSLCSTVTNFFHSQELYDECLFRVFLTFLSFFFFLAERLCLGADGRIATMEQRINILKCFIDASKNNCAHEIAESVVSRFGPLTLSEGFVLTIEQNVHKECFFDIF